VGFWDKPADSKVRLGLPPEKGAINNTIKYNISSMYLSGLKISFFGMIEKKYFIDE
jgi:hypothetical protein